VGIQAACAQLQCQQKQSETNIPHLATENVKTLLIINDEQEMREMQL
jgi:hypothetical protein